MKHSNKNIQFTISRAEHSQMESIAKVFKQSRLHSLPYLPDLHTEEEDIAFFSNIVFKEQNVYVAFESKSKVVVGFIAFDSKWLNHLYVGPEFQNQGVGQALLDIAKEQATNLNLWTFQKNINAQNFYTKNGFEVVKETDGSDNEEKEPDVLMRWVQSKTEPLRTIERTDEPISGILKFYESQGYGGGANEDDKIFLTYRSNELICVLRVALEEDTPVFRGMYMKENMRGKGFGKEILKSIEPHLDSYNSPIFCIPKAHLESFYSTIGFKKIDTPLAPDFLKNRLGRYVDEGYDVILMLRLNNLEGVQ